MAKAKVWKPKSQSAGTNKKPIEQIAKSDKVGSLKSRIFWMTQYVQNPKTGEILFTSEYLKSGLAHKTIKRWSWAMHDKDVWHDYDAPYLVDDSGNKSVATGKDGKPLLDESGEPYYKRDLSYVGRARPRHVHIAIETTQQMPLRSIAKWFHIPMNMIQLKKGAGTFLDLTEYLTHEADAQQEKGKHRYTDKEIHASEGFDWRAELDKRNATRLRYGTDLSLKDRIQMDILEGRKTVNDVLRSADIQLKLLMGTQRADWLGVLYRARAAYLATQQPPKTRLNYYLTGKGGSGKGLLAKALARSLYPTIEDDRDIFFEVGQKGNLFDSYDGQPVLIWNDFRGKDLLKALGSRGDVFNVFESHPTFQKRNKKFGEVSLINAVNIVNSVQEPFDFCNDLVGETRYADGRIKEKAEDPNQIYRRFPVFIFIHPEDYQMYVSAGFLDENADYSDYVSNAKMKQNLRAAISATGGVTEVYKAEERRTVKAITDEHRKLLDTPTREFKPVGGQIVEHEEHHLNMQDEQDKQNDFENNTEKENYDISDEELPF